MKQFLLPLEPAPTGEPLVLKGKNHHYLVHVRRHTPGDRIPAISPSGTRFTMEMISSRRDSCTFALERDPDNPEDPDDIPVRITLMPAVTRGKKIDLTIRQAVEAGASAIWPVLTEHSQVKFPDAGDRIERAERWNRIAVEALQQCGGRRPASVEPPMELEKVVDLWNHRGPLIFLHEKKLMPGSTGSLHGNLAEEVDELAIIVGPEGGLSSGEVRLLTGWGARPLFLGNRVLRAETAALYALAAAGTIIRERAEWQPK